MEKNIDLKTIILDTLDSNKALDIISIDLKNKSSMADYMIIASGTSSRHIQALSEQVLEKFKDNSLKTKYGNVCNKCRKPKNPYWGYRGYRRRY